MDSGPSGNRYPLCRRRPIFPGSFPPSIFGTGELNFRVRDGNGWDLTVINTGYSAVLVSASVILCALPSQGSYCITRTFVRIS